MDPRLVSRSLEELADRSHARRRAKHVRPLRGLRGCPLSGVSRVAADLWRAGPVRLAADRDALHTLFCTAHEDGLVAIALAAAAAPDAPEVALELAELWIPMADDLETADALGWVLVGPSLLSAGLSITDSVVPVADDGGAMERRIAVMTAMTLLPISPEGPATAALKLRTEGRPIRFVEEARTQEVAQVVTAFEKDVDPHVRKALGRLIRCWGEEAPEEVEEWLSAVIHRGGIPRPMRAEAEVGRKKGVRRRERAARRAQEKSDA